MFEVAAVDAFAISMPLISPMKLAGIEISTADNLIVRVTDRDGNVGWGEGASAPTMTGETPEGMVSAVRFLAPQLVGMEVDEPAAIHRRLDRLMYGNHGAKAAIEIAILDLAGKHSRTPLYEMLGGRVRESADILTMVAGGELAQETDNAKRQLDAGFRAFKVKVGVNDPGRDLERATAIRSATGNGPRISADANQGYSREEALEFAEGAAQAGLDFMEQLVYAEDLEGMAACAAATGVPLGADEGFHSQRDIIAHHEAGAAAGGSLKTIKLGGAFGVVEAGRLMDGLGMHVNLAGKLAETSIASAAIAHLAVSLPRLDWDASVTNQYLAEDVVAEPLRVVDGAVRPPEAPGLGVAPDEDRLRGFTALR